MSTRIPTFLPVSLTIAAWVAGLSLGAVRPAAAHPHVFAQSHVEIVGAAGGALGAIRNVWRMDELFSSQVLVEFDKNANGRLDDDELEDVGKTIRDSIAEYSFYTSVTTNGRQVKLAPPDAIHALDQDGQLLLFFEMRAEEPLDLAKHPLTVSNFDESFYTAFDFNADSFQLVDMPPACRTNFVRPDEDAAAKKWIEAMAALGPDDAAPADGVNYSQILAARMEIRCG
nr:DUF1007 family protein [Aurantimonas sp. VKM B-3413]